MGAPEIEAEGHEDEVKDANILIYDLGGGAKDTLTPQPATAFIKVRLDVVV
jgi:hypothetical protein